MGIPVGMKAIIKGGLIRIVRFFPWLDQFLLGVRRKILARSDAYPNWKNLTNQKALNTGNENKKVLIATSIGGHLAAMQVETTLAAALVLRGAQVEALLCDKILPGCQLCEPRFFKSSQEMADNGPQKKICGDCFEPGKKNYEDLGIPVISYSSQITKKNYDLAAKIAKETPFSEIGMFEYEGVKIGEHSQAGALRFFASATLENEPTAEVVLRRYLQASMLTMFALDEVFSKTKYDVAVFHHGIYVPQGTVGEVARKHKVRVVNWNPAYRESCFIFSHDDTYHHTLMSENVSSWENIPWTEALDRKISTYLKSRWAGENDWIRFTENPVLQKDKILSEIGCDVKKPIVTCLTNVMWDAQLHYPANTFSNMLEWLIFTIKYFETRQDLQLIIRVHPAEIKGAVPTRQPVVKEIEKHFPHLPKNVFVVGPESQASTYVLSELSDSVIIYGTKTGVELTAVGIPVIVCGEAWIRNKGISEDITSKDNYTQILDSLPKNKRLTADNVVRAKKYAYHFFFRRMIPMLFFKKNAGWPPYKLVIDSVADLRPDNSKGLDTVCNGILSGKPFVYDETVA